MKFQVTVAALFSSLLAGAHTQVLSLRDELRERREGARADGRRWRRRSGHALCRGAREHDALDRHAGATSSATEVYSQAPLKRTWGGAACLRSRTRRATLLRCVTGISQLLRVVSVLTQFHVIKLFLSARSFPNGILWRALATDSNMLSLVFLLALCLPVTLLHFSYFTKSCNICYSSIIRLPLQHRHPLQKYSAKPTGFVFFIEIQECE